MEGGCLVSGLGCSCCPTQPGWRFFQSTCLRALAFSYSTVVKVQQSAVVERSVACVRGLGPLDLMLRGVKQG